MTLRPRNATIADLPGAATLLAAAYGPNPFLRARFKTYLGVQPDGWVVVEDASTLVGIGGFVAFGRSAYIGLMGVSPGAQRRGVGSAVLEELLRRCEARGCTLLLLDASDEGAPLYERYAFTDRGLSLRYAMKPRVAPPRDGNGGVVVQTLTGQGPGVDAEIAALDARCFGADRSNLVRAHVQALRHRTFVVRDASGELVGYCTGQARSLGPCMATSSEVARALVVRTLCLPFETEVSWILPEQNADAAALARDLGGTPDGTRRHMRRGDDTQFTSDWSNLFAKVSPAVG